MTYNLTPLVPSYIDPTLPARRRDLLLARRAILLSRTSLLAFAQYMRPDPDHYDDPTKSTYEIQEYHALIAEKLEALERGGITRLIIDVPPRHGKSELANRTFVPWCMGLHPDWHFIVATYGAQLSGDFGRAVRDIVQDERFRRVFPDTELKAGSAAADRLETTKGGIAVFTGRGGTATGRGAHLIVIDDPLKDRAEADSKAIRDKLWTWFTQVISTRLMTQDCRILLIQTRWHEDDLIGRLTNPHNNPFYNAKEAARWTHVRLPALAEDDDPLGRKEGMALWPNRFGPMYLSRLRDQDNRGFSALYQGRPSPGTGLFFTPEDIVEYQDMRQVPQNVRYFAASDHAVSQSQWADKSVFMPIAVDENNDIWIMPDTSLHKLPSDQAVELMLVMIKKYKPLFWWAETGHISKAIGPFLRKRMLEEQTFCAIRELTPTQDKQTRAQSIKGRMAMGKVHFPAWTGWYAEARDQILSFPAGAKDDFVDTLSLVGLGLGLLVSAKAPRAAPKEFAPGTLGALKAQSDQQRKAAELAKATKGW